MLGFGGNIKVFLTMNSFRMSFWIVPVNFSLGQPCSSPEAIKLAKTGITAPFIVIETLI